MPCRLPQLLSGVSYPYRKYLATIAPESGYFAEKTVVGKVHRGQGGRPDGQLFIACPYN